MKKLVIIFYFLSNFLLHAQNLYWTGLNGQLPGNIFCVDTDSSDNLFASTSQSKIFRSTDAGLSWQFLYQTPYFPINKFSITSNQDIFAIGGPGYILYSSNSGDNWQLKNSGIKNFDLILTIAKTQTGKLLAGAYTDCLSCPGGGIYSSVDNGLSWSFVDLLGNYINSIIRIPNNKIMASGYSGVYVSTNDGGSWQLKNSGMPQSQFVKYLALNDNNTVFAAAAMYSGLMYKSSDEGETWIQCNSGLPNDEVSGLVCSNNILFVSYKNAGVYRSDNGGTSWEPASYFIPNFEFNALNKSEDGALLTATSGGIFKNQNLGVAWFKLTNSISHLAITSINCSRNSNLLVGTDYGGIYRSTDFGANWTQFELINTENGYDVNGIEYKSENNVFASVHGYVIYKSLFSSTDNGSSWIHSGVGYSTQYGITCLYIDQVEKIYCGEFSKFFWTTNNGVQWVNQPCSFSWIKDVVSNGNGIVLAATYGNGIYRSTANGIGFSESGLANQHVRSVAVDNNGVFYAGSDYGLYRSTDNGISWTQVIHPNIISTVFDIKITKDNIITAAGRGFHYSTDDGQTWNVIENGIEDTYLTCISFDSLDNVYVGSYNGIYLLNKPIPVELLSFSSSVVDDDVTLNWATATETNNSGFKIERKSPSPTPSLREGTFDDWESIGFVNGYGTTTEPQTYSFIDKNLSAGKYQYRLKQIDFDGTFEYSNIVEAEIFTPARFSLEQNFPNPFNPSTKIKYTIPNVTLSGALPTGRQVEGSRVVLRVFDVLGNEVATLVNEEKPAGNYEVQFNATTLSTGVYFYTLQAGSFIQTKKMTILK
ncbi:MAG: T9SS type A sorting domain-containing protein [Ignavibacterium sp.]|nr:T9SS type A sorting domain-containing protein [Ignavibacterium sp.]